MENDESYITCIGVDGKLHECLPWEDLCSCGMKILRKKILDRDYERFSCYECTY